MDPDTMDPDKDFLAIYQENLFQETTSDLYKTADLRRKRIALTFKAASKLFNNAAVCDILEDMLPSYTKLVDDPNGINNYASNIEAITPNDVERECSQWKSNLGAYDLEDLLEPLPCGGIICRESEITEQHIKALFQNRKDETTAPKNIQPNNTNKFKQQSKPLFSSAGNIQNKRTIYQPPVINTVDPQPGCSKDIYPKPQFPSTSKKVSPMVTSKNSEEPKDKFSMFKTAKDELHVQNLKKYGKANVSEQQPSLNYGGQKRSLGTRRGVQNKFIPPVLRDGGGAATLSKNSGNENYNDEMEELDERLKNIDAKMVELIRSEIMDSGPPISWDDIAGLEFAKTAIKEAVVWPLLRPDIFTGLRRPPKGILLFGPPGTGKTLIGKCIASQSQSTFFSISASSLTSKWIGDGEKMVRAMFAVARCHQPAVIFIDEIDSLLSQRSDTEHESSRRIKTEFLVQLDGAGTAEDERILLVGATNRPQELDEAARRRFVKRLYIPLPEKTARFEIVKRLMNTERNDLSMDDIDEIAVLSDGYSGADMKNLCSEASLGPIRSIDINLIQNIQADQVRAVTRDDFKLALNRVRASVSPADLEQYIAWDKTYGSGGW